MATKLKPHTQEEQVNCEVARDLIAEFYTLWAQQIAAEKKASTPNPAKIKTLELLLAQAHRERLELDVDNQELINRALYFYAPYLKAVNS